MKFLTMMVIALAVVQISNAQTISSGPLNISIESTINNGAEISSIKNIDQELLNTAVSNVLFSLDILSAQNNTITTIISNGNWATNVTLSNQNADGLITFSSPNQSGIPSTLIVSVSIHTDGIQSAWDLNVAGLGQNYSLMEVEFPRLNILGNGGHFLIPRYSGQIFEDPATGMDYTGHYPRGNATNMQFMAYYGSGTDIYFGFHDPNAASKVFLVNDENEGVQITCELPVADKTLVGNDWEFPGHFELDLFNGNWYDAAMIYKGWASTFANYWPENTAARQARQAEIGKIGVWFYDIGYYNGNARSADRIELGTQKCIDYLGVPIATHLYSWAGIPNDDDYPETFPAIEGLDDAVETLYDNGALIMPYFNGRLYDTALVSFAQIGLPDATKDESGAYYFQDFNNSDGESIHFAVMCPTQ